MQDLRHAYLCYTNSNLLSCSAVRMSILAEIRDSMLFCTLVSCLLSEKENSVKPAMQYFSPSVSVRILVVAKNNTWANYFN